MSDAQLLGLAVMALGLLFVIRRYRRDPNRSRGSAGWLKLWQAAWAVLSTTSGIGLFRSLDLRGDPGFLLGDWLGIPIGRWHFPCLLPVFYRGPSNILTVGSPGAMKGAGVLIVNALRHPFQVLYDLGGEITAVCIKSWRIQGWEVMILNPWGRYLGEPYNFSMGSLNPLDTIDPDSESFSSDVLLMATEIMGEPPQGEGEYFHKKAIKGYDALIKHNLIYEKNPENQNLVRVRQYFRGSEREWADLILQMTESKDEAVRAVGHEWHGMRMKKEKQFGSIISTMESATMWLDDEPIRRSICSSTIRLRDLKGYDEKGKKLKGAILSIVIPQQYKDSHAVYARLILGSILREMMSGKVARSKVLMTVDEFPSLKKWTPMVGALSEMRRYRLRICLVIQSIAQLKNLYGEAGWKAIEGACDVRQYLSAWGLDTAEHVSNMCGDQTIIETHLGQSRIFSRRLIMPDEVMRMAREHQIVFINNLAPARLRIRPYWERSDMRGSVNDNPVHGTTPHPPATWFVQAVSGFGMRICAGLIGPVSIVAAVALAVAYGVSQ